jgi:NO-binding membrane sensor protein with MHYT domain
MFAYVLLLVAVLTRVLPHAWWFNFTAVTGGLLFFGARRPWREMLVPLAVLIATDCYLTIAVYHYAFHWQGYITTWAWYLAAMALGQILLKSKTTFVRGAAGAVLGPTSFFAVSNYGVWAGSGMYPHTLAGLGACFLAGVPFYRNDLVATSIVLAVALGAPALARRMRPIRPASVQVDA